MKIFYFLARHISYTFALSVFIVFMGWIAGFFAYILGCSFIILSYEKITGYLVRWLPIAILTGSLLHYIQFGFLTPVGVGALFRSHRELNRAFRKNLAVGNREIEKLYSSICDLPMQAMIVSVFYTAIVGLIVTGLAWYEFKFNNKISFSELKVILKVTGLSYIIGVILYGMSSYLVAETFTNKERSIVYNRLIKFKKTKPFALIGIRVKFQFFVILMVISLLTFAAFTEWSRFYGQYSFGMILAYFVITILAVYLIMEVNTRSIIRILHDMLRVTKEIAAGRMADFSVLPLEIEIASIEYALIDMAWQIDEYRKNIEGLVEQRTAELQNAMENLKNRDDQMQRQLDMASLIQKSMIPRRIEDWNELKFSVRYLAMEKIGGDFYDVMHLKNNKIGIMIADVSGHGIPAALVTSMAKITFRNAGTLYDSPKRIFQDVNQNILAHVRTQDYLTCFMAVIDDEYRVVYSNASHQKAIVLRTRTEKIELLDTNGLFIGAIEDAYHSYAENTTKLEYGDRIVLYTDGIPESHNERNEEYSIERLEQLILKNRNLPLEEFSNAVIEDVRNHMGSKDADDDITLLVIELVRDEAVEVIRNARKLIASRSYPEVLKLLEQGLAMYPENQKIMYNLAKTYLRTGKHAASLEMMKKYINFDRNNKYAYYIAGAACYQLLDYENAVDSFERALACDQNFVPAAFALGMTYKKSGDRHKAKRAFENVISIDPENRQALSEIGALGDD